MISIFFIILTLCWLILGSWVIYYGFRQNDDIAALGFIIILIALGSNGATIVSHIHDLALIRNQAILIEPKEEAIARITQELQNLPQSTSLMNADSPARSMIETKSEYVKELTAIKTDVADAKLSIERRKMGAGAWAVWLWGDK